MIDTNVIISGILFPSSIPARVIEEVSSRHTLVLCSHIIDELHLVFKRKFKDKILSLEKFLERLSFKLIYTPKKIEMTSYPDIPDKSDLPILVSAILGDIDVLITGDKEFRKVKIDRPEILSPIEFIERWKPN